MGVDLDVVEADKSSVQRTELVGGLVAGVPKEIAGKRSKSRAKRIVTRERVRYAGGRASRERVGELDLQKWKSADA